MPSIYNVHQDRPLSNVAQEYPSQQDKFMGWKFFPRVLVNNRSDEYYKVDAARKALTEARDRMAAGAVATEIDWATTTGTYACQKYGLKRVIPEEVMANADVPLAGKIRGTQHIMDRLLLGIEVRVAAALAAGRGTTLAQTTNRWDDDSSDVIGAVQTAIDTIEDACGQTPNTMLMDGKVFRRLQNQAQILQRVVYGGTPADPSRVTQAALSQILGVQNILVAGGVKNTASEGQTASLSRIWSDSVYLAYVPGGPAIDVEAAGYNFVWNRPGSSDGWRARTWTNEERDAEEVQVDIYYDVEIINGALIYEWTDVLA